MATATYSGTGLTCGGWTAAGNPDPEADGNDMTAECGHSVSPDGEVVLTGETGMTEGFGGHRGDQLPNLNITHVSRPATVRSEPANTAAMTNPLGAAKPKGAAAAARGRNYSAGRGK